MKRITLTVLSLILIIGILGAGTYAWFSANAATATATLSAGTLALSGEGFVSFDFGEITLAPGDVTEEKSIIIENAGDLPLAWFGDWEFTGGTKLREALYIEYAKMEFLRPDGTSWEPEDNFIAGGKGAGSYPGWYNTLASQSTFGLVTFNVWDGNNGMGSAPYEHMGALKPGYSYKLTVKFGFAPDAGNEYQGDKVSPVNVQFRVDATQVTAGALDAVQAGFGAKHLSWMDAQLAKQQ